MEYSFKTEFKKKAIRFDVRNKPNSEKGKTISSSSLDNSIKCNNACNAGDREDTNKKIKGDLLN